MSDLARQYPPGHEPGRIYSPELATPVRPGTADDARQYPPGKEPAIPVKPGSGNDAV